MGREITQEDIMFVKFYCYSDESDVYEMEENMTEEELIDAACEWVCNNANVGYEIIEEDESIEALEW